MPRKFPTPRAHDKLLFTPGPLTTSPGVKQAMLRDLGSRDVEFGEAIVRIRRGLLELAGVSQEQGWEAVPMQGSGTFCVEAAIGSCVPRDGALAVAANGAYGERIATIAEVLGIPVAIARSDETAPTELDAVRRALDELPGATHLAAVHCETSTGVLNPVEELGALAKERDLTFVLDSMSAFGAVPIDLERARVDVLVSSANKCVEGVPGFGFALVRRAVLEAAAGTARSLSLDLHAQWAGLEANGQFRFTPPTHALLAFDRALQELADEGGVAGRNGRYRRNHQVLVEGMRALGFREHVAPEHQGPIITSFHFHDDPRFDFHELYVRLSVRGYVIYPGKVSQADCFRVGSIGRLFEADVRALLAAVREVLLELGVELPR